MKKIALINDTHFGARVDSTALLKYFSLFYSNVFFPALEENNIKTIVHLGDFFDRRKYINTFTANQAREMFTSVASNYDLHIIAGNHDCFYKHTNSVNSLDEFIHETPKRRFYTEACTQIIEGVPILFVPWITPENEEVFQRELATTEAKILFGHLELAGFEMYRGAFSDHGLDKTLFQKFELVCSGHFHHKSTYQNIHYLGSPYEMTWADYNDIKGFHLLDLETLELEFIQNPYRLFHKVFYDDTKSSDTVDFAALKDGYVKVVVVNKTNPIRYDAFISEIEAAEPANIQIIEDHLKLSIADDREMFSEAESTEDILKHAIRQLGVDSVREKEVESLLTSIYQEASQVII